MSKKSAVECQVRRSASGQVENDWVVAEEPLEIRVEGRALAVTMRTPGHDRELAAGFLFTEGCVDGPDDLHALASVSDPRTKGDNIVDVRLASGTPYPEAALASAQRNLYATSSCGICGKASIDRVLRLAPPVEPVPELPASLLVSMPEKMRAAQKAFQETGGIHAAALFTLEGQLEVLREDVGRHNAVDKVLGWRLLQDRVPVDDCILMVSGRAGFELVQKAVVAGVPAMVAVGAPSSLAVELAQSSGIQLVGFLRGERFNRYTLS